MKFVFLCDTYVYDDARFPEIARNNFESYLDRDFRLKFTHNFDGQTW